MQPFCRNNDKLVRHIISFDSSNFSGRLLLALCYQRQMGQLFFAPNYWRQSVHVSYSDIPWIREKRICKLSCSIREAVCVTFISSGLMWPAIRRYAVNCQLWSKPRQIFLRLRFSVLVHRLKQKSTTWTCSGGGWFTRVIAPPAVISQRVKIFW